ncbi:MAG: HAD-IA family hydrolase, partial [Anaerolineales bacterium]|nr:HAD-IA family hydrolase [Anaerolineales bacterium]
AELIQAYDSHWEESLTETHHETIQIAKNLKRSGWPLYLLSNFSAEKFDIVKQRYDFLKLFDDMIVSGEHKLVKPNADIFAFTLNRIQRKASECLFIDDSLPNIRTANKMGFITIHYLSPAQLKRDLYQLSIKDY